MRGCIAFVALVVLNLLYGGRALNSTNSTNGTNSTNATFCHSNPIPFYNITFEPHTSCWNESIVSNTSVECNVSCVGGFEIVNSTKATCEPNGTWISEARCVACQPGYYGFNSECFPCDTEATSKRGDPACKCNLGFEGNGGICFFTFIWTESKDPIVHLYLEFFDGIPEDPDTFALFLKSDLQLAAMNGAGLFLNESQITIKSINQSTYNDTYRLNVTNVTLVFLEIAPPPRILLEPANITALRGYIQTFYAQLLDPTSTLRNGFVTQFINPYYFQFQLDDLLIDALLKLPLSQILSVLLGVTVLVIVWYFVNRKYFPTAQNGRVVGLYIASVSFIANATMASFLAPLSSLNWAYLFVVIPLLVPVGMNTLALGSTLLSEYGLNAPFRAWYKEHKIITGMMFVTSMTNTKHFRILDSGILGLSSLKAPLGKKIIYWSSFFSIMGTVVGDLPLIAAQVTVALHLGQFTTANLVQLLPTIINVATNLTGPLWDSIVTLHMKVFGLCFAAIESAPSEVVSATESLVSQSPSQIVSSLKSSVSEEVSISVDEISRLPAPSLSPLIASAKQHCNLETLQEAEVEMSTLSVSRVVSSVSVRVDNLDASVIEEKVESLGERAGERLLPMAKTELSVVAGKVPIANVKEKIQSTILTPAGNLVKQDLSSMEAKALGMAQAKAKEYAPKIMAAAKAEAIACAQVAETEAIADIQDEARQLAPVIANELKDKAIELAPQVKDQALKLVKTVGSDAKAEAIKLAPTIISTAKSDALKLAPGMKAEALKLAPEMKAEVIRMAPGLKDEALKLAPALKDEAIKLAPGVQDQALKLVSTVKAEAPGLASSLKDQALKAAPGLEAKALSHLQDVSIPKGLNPAQINVGVVENKLTSGISKIGDKVGNLDVKDMQVAAQRAGSSVVSKVSSIHIDPSQIHVDPQAMAKSLESGASKLKNMNPQELKAQMQNLSIQDLEKLKPTMPTSVDMKAGVSRLMGSVDSKEIASHLTSEAHRMETSLMDQKVLPVPSSEAIRRKLSQTITTDNLKAATSEGLKVTKEVTKEVASHVDTQKLEAGAAQLARKAANSQVVKSLEAKAEAKVVQEISGGSAGSSSGLSIQGALEKRVDSAIADPSTVLSKIPVDQIKAAAGKYKMAGDEATALDSRYLSGFKSIAASASDEMNVISAQISAAEAQVEQKVIKKVEQKLENDALNQLPLDQAQKAILVKTVGDVKSAELQMKQQAGVQPEDPSKTKKKKKKGKDKDKPQSSFLSQVLTSAATEVLK